MTLRRRLLVTAFVGCSPALLGCDIVQGFQNAGDALFPPVKTYLDAPGYRLVSGGYRYMTLIASDELFLIARSSKDGDTGLYSMRYADPRPCAIPDVGRYWAGGNAALERAYIAHFPAGKSQGTLSFSDEACHVSAFTLPEAELPPVAMIDPPQPVSKDNPPTRSLVLRSQGNLVALSADAESAELLLENAGPTLTGVGSLTFVYSGGTIVAFDDQWHEVQRFGDGVVAWGITGGKLFYEETPGISRATLKSVNGRPALDLELVAEQGCELGFPSSSQHWVSMLVPCEAGPIRIWDDRDDTLVDYGIQADPRALRIVLPSGVSRPDLERDALWSFFLRDIDYSVGLGTLFVRNLEREEIELGERAALERAAVSSKDDYGYALVELDGERGRYLRWKPDGTIDTLADDVLRDGTGLDWAPLLVDWNGTTGALARIVDDHVEHVMEGVPRRHYAYKDLHGRVAMFNDFDGTSGTLSIGVPTCDGGGTGCAHPYFTPSPIAHHVFHPRHDFLDSREDFLPGIAWLADYDSKRDTGRFEYRNLELGFTSIVNDGVSDFLYAGNGLLYSVPFGDRAGLWLARAK